MWLLAMIVVQVRLGHIRADLAHASPPIWFQNVVNARLVDGLSWLDMLVIAGLAIIAALAAFAVFAWMHFGQALYDVWLLHEIRAVWNRRPWKKPAAKNAKRPPARKSKKKP